MIHIKVLTCGFIVLLLMVFAQSNKYFEFIIECLKPNIFNKKVEVLFFKEKENSIKHQFSH